MVLWALPVLCLLGDDAALKGLFVAIQEASKNWNPIQFWKPALQSFQIMFGDDRVPWNAI
jgi:putative transposase